MPCKTVVHRPPPASRLRFQPRSKKNFAKLKCQLFAAKIEPGEDVRKFIARVNAIADQLNAIVGKGQPDGISRVS